MTNLTKSSDFKPAVGRMESVGMDIPTIKKEISFAVQQINGNKQLIKTDVMSRINAVINIANIGLTLNPASNEAYLIPRWNSATRVTECTLMPSYIGLMKLIMKNSDVIDVMCNVVHKGDDITVELTNSKNPVQHNYSFDHSEEIVGAYAVATFKDGTKHAEVMRLFDLDRIREMSESYKAYKAGKMSSCVWVDHYSEMCRKTVIRRLAKYLPRTKSNKELDNAVELDNLDFSAPVWLTSKIESNLRTANISESESENIWRLLETNMSTQKANEINNFLLQNQIEDRDEVIMNGTSMSMKEIGRAVEQSVELENS